MVCRSCVSFLLVLLAVVSVACSRTSSSNTASLLPDFDPEGPRFIVVAEPLILPRETTEAERRTAASDLEQRWKSGQLSDAEFFRESKQLRSAHSDSYIIHDELLEPLLVAALVQVKNFTVLDPSFVERARGGAYRITRGTYRGQKVYAIRISITEVNQEADGEERSVNKMPLAGEASTAEVLAAVPLMLTGFWVSQLTMLPTEYYSKRITGVVGADVEVYDGETGRVVAAFPVRGTHTFVLKELGNEFAGGMFTKKSASSSTTRAIAAALQEAAQQSYSHLLQTEKR